MNRHCPRCGTRLKRRTPPYSGIPIDVCPEGPHVSNEAIDGP